MGLQFLDEEIKEGLAEFAHPDLKEISRQTGIGYTYTKENFNANADRKSHAFFTLRIACALHDIDEERGDLFIERLVDFYELSKARKVGSQFNANAEAAKFVKVAGEISGGRLAGESSYDMLIRLQKAERQLAALRRAILDEIRSETQGFLSPDGLRKNGGKL